MNAVSAWNSVAGSAGTAVDDEMVGTALHGLRLDRAVALSADVSRSAAAKLIGKGAVSLDGVVAASRSERVVAQQRLSVDISGLERPREPQPDDSVEFSTVHSDDHVIVIDKPAGLVVHPAPGHADSTLVNGLLARFPEIADVGDKLRPGIVHRLDRYTSGLMMVARTGFAYECLTAQLRDRRPERAYSALVHGHPASDFGVVEAPIGRSSRNPMRMSVNRRGRSAVTRYRVLHRFSVPNPTALLSCRLETGRTHQLRVHLEAIGHAVVGDRVYSDGRSSSPDAETSLKSLGLQRLFLHAGSLAFRHPESGAAVRFDSGLPEDLSVVLSAIQPSVS